MQSIDDLKFKTKTKYFKPKLNDESDQNVMFNPRMFDRMCSKNSATGYWARGMFIVQ